MEKFTDCLAVAVVLAAMAVVAVLVLSLGAVGLWVAVFAVLGLFCWSCDPDSQTDSQTDSLQG